MPGYRPSAAAQAHAPPLGAHGTVLPNVQPGQLMAIYQGVNKRGRPKFMLTRDGVSGK